MVNWSAQTDEECIRDKPISILEIPQIYAEELFEGVQHDGDNSDEKKRTIEFKAHESNTSSS